MHDNSCSGVHANSSGTYTYGNSRVERGHDGCGRTKPLSTSTRCHGRPAVKKLALLQQVSRRVHEETWAGCKGSLSLKISHEVEIVPECAVTVSYLPSPFIAPVLPGPGRDVRNMLGWSQVVKTARMGIWLFQGALQGEKFFFPCCSGRLGKERIVPHSVVGPPSFFVFLPIFVGQGTATGHELAGGVGCCLLDCGGLSHP